MRTLKLLLAFFIVLGTTPMALAHDDRDDRNTVRARLSGYNEVHFIAAPPALRGAVSTPASGRFTATIDDRNQMIHYEISYSGLVSFEAQSAETTTSPRPAGAPVVGIPINLKSPGQPGLFPMSPLIALPCSARERPAAIVEWS